MERHKIKNDLINAGFSDVQGDALSYIYAEMSTKEDFRELRSEMHGEFRAVRSEMHSEFRAIRDEVKQMEANLRLAIAESTSQTLTTIAAFQNKLFVMTLGLIGAITTIFTALELFLD